MKKGIFISFEGTDGAGKSTQIAFAEDYFKSRGYDVVMTREPGGTPIGEKLREILLDKSNSEMSSVRGFEHCISGLRKRPWRCCFYR